MLNPYEMVQPTYGKLIALWAATPTAAGAATIPIFRHHYEQSGVA
jgi:hypothetical protein